MALLAPSMHSMYGMVRSGLLPAPSLQKNFLLLCMQSTQALKTHWEAGAVHGLCKENKSMFLG